jgi:hypothetical protein
VRVLTRRALALARRSLAAGGHLRSPWRPAPAAGSLLRPAAPPHRAEPRAAAGSPAMDHPVALVPTVRPLRDPRRRVRRRRASRRAAPTLTPPPETRHRQ